MDMTARSVFLSGRPSRRIGIEKKRPLRCAKTGDLQLDGVSEKAAGIE